jgi:hypothetical protein
MRNRMFFALFIIASLGGCMVVPTAPAYYSPAGAYVQPAPVYYSPVYPSYWGPSFYFGGGYRGGHRGRW